MRNIIIILLFASSCSAQTVTRYHSVNGKRVPFTAQENRDRDKEELEWKTVSKQDSIKAAKISVAKNSLVLFLFSQWKDNNIDSADKIRVLREMAK